MINKPNTPSLRFPQFSGKWKIKKFGEVAKFSKGKGISKSDIVKDGNIKCIRYGELYTTYSETINDVVSSTNIDSSNLILSEENDVIIPASGETQIDIATASCVLKKGIALGGDLNIIKSANNGVFLSYYLNSSKKNEIANLAQGISVVHLYASQLATVDLNLPTLPEQEKIAGFLTVVDEKLQALKKKKALLEDYKKGIMQRIFSGNLRFKDAHGQPYPDWEVRKLGEVLTIGSGKDYKHLDDGDVPVFGTGGFMRYVNSFLYEGETVCIGRKGTIDKPFYFFGKIWTVDTLFFTHSFINSSPKYIFCQFQMINWLEYNEASGVPSLSKSTIEKIEINLPSLPEQEKIAEFLGAIDAKITALQTQLNKTLEWKKGLLQGMFC